MATTLYGDDSRFHYNPDYAQTRRITISSNEHDQWSTFWKQGFITTFGAGKPGNYDGVVFDFWQDKFRELQHRARVLDIAAGNGAVATLAAEFSLDHGTDFFVAATDLAEIETELIGEDKTTAARKNIEFHSRVPCEQQPFDDDSFDLVTSQFGFEYSDISKTLPEIRRVLAPNGRFVAVVHHAESELIVAAKRELALYTLALDELDVFRRLVTYHEALGNLEGPQEEVVTRVKGANDEAKATLDALKTIEKAFPGEEAMQQVNGTVSALARPQFAEAEKRIAAVRIAQTDFEAGRRRLVDMKSAALTEDDVNELQHSADDAGFSAVHCLKLYDGQSGLAGWQVHMR